MCSHFFLSSPSPVIKALLRERPVLLFTLTWSTREHTHTWGTRSSRAERTSINLSERVRCAQVRHYSRAKCTQPPPRPSQQSLRRDYRLMHPAQACSSMLAPTSCAILDRRRRCRCHWNLAAASCAQSGVLVALSLLLFAYLLVCLRRI